ncbi:MAG TPA: allantoinase AllB [Bacteroidetes bacterium]|nr:allantoinase AllB [Bacteroidota bacterium]
MPPTHAIHSHRTYLDGHFQPATVFIKNGRIHSIKKGKPGHIGCPLEEVGNAVLMPGLTDPHVHINEPGRTDWEGFDTATKAAAAGGITTLVDMPLNSSPVTTSPQNFQKKLAAAEGKLHVNCGFWGGIVPSNAGEMEALLASGVLGIKAFLTHSGIDEFPNVTAADLRKGMSAIAKSGLPLLVHCELENAAASVVTADLRSYQSYLRSRPKAWENAAIELMVSLCREFGCRTHIVHLSSAEALPVIIKAKKEGLPLTVETCAHYLYFDAENIPDADTRYKCAPPIREKENNEQLWEALRNGTIDFLATDHSPAPPEMKQLESGDLRKAWGGISSLQFLLPIIWTAARQRGFELKNIVAWLVEKPAQFIGQGHRKGKIAVGYDADLVVWQPEEIFEIKTENIFHRHKITPYLGQQLFGKTIQTYIGGAKVFEDGGIAAGTRGKVILHK